MKAMVKDNTVQQYSKQSIEITVEQKELSKRSLRSTTEDQKQKTAIHKIFITNMIYILLALSSEDE